MTTEDTPRELKSVPMRQIRPVAMRQIRTSGGTQPRNAESIEVRELSESIKENGLIHPPHVRTRTFPEPDPELGSFYFELLVGERRFHACDLLGWKEIPVEVRDDLDDLGIFLLQLAENHDRKPLTPLEEADAVRRLMTPKSDGGFGIDDTAEISARLHLSEATVYQRLALSKATPRVRAALTKDRIYLGTAIGLASINDDDAQNEALTEVDNGSDERMPVRRALNVIEQTFHLRLASPPFDTTIAGLVDGVPECGACPKRSGTPRQRALFTEPTQGGHADDQRCTDRKCFGAKTAAWSAREVARAKAEGLKVVEGTEGSQLYPAGVFLPTRAPGFADLDAKVPNGGGITIREAIAAALKSGAVVVTALVVDGDNRVHYLADLAKVNAALGIATPGAAGGKSSGAGAAPTPATSTPGGKVEKGPAPEKGDEGFVLQRKAEEAAGLEALGEIYAAAGRRKRGDRFYRFIVRALVSMPGAQLGSVVERHELRIPGGKKTPDKDLLIAWLDGKSEDEVAGMLAELASAQDGLHPDGTEADESHGLIIASRFYSIDLAGLTKAAHKRLKAAEKRTTKEPAAKAKPAKEEPAKVAPEPVREKGKCSACGCHDDAPCLPAPPTKAEGCVWADVGETLCSVCAHIQAMAIEIVESSSKPPSGDELAAVLADRLAAPGEPLAIASAKLPERITLCLADAGARRKLVNDKGKFRSLGVREVPKASGAGATPSEEVPVRTRLVLWLRARPGKKATRREILDGSKNMKPATTPAECLREIAQMGHHNLIKVGAETTDPIELIAPSYDEAREELAALGVPELKARWTAVMGSAPTGAGTVELAHRLAMRLSGEWRAAAGALAPSPAPSKGKAKPAAAPAPAPEKAAKSSAPNGKANGKAKAAEPAAAPAVPVYVMRWKGTGSATHIVSTHGPGVAVCGSDVSGVPEVPITGEIPEGSKLCGNCDRMKGATGKVHSAPATAAAPS